MRATVLDMALCLSVRLSVCLSVTSRCSIEDERIELGFFVLHYMLKGNSVQGISKIRALPSGTLSETSEVEKLDRRNVIDSARERLAPRA